MCTTIQSSGSKTVDRLAGIQLTGNIIPHNWYKTITFKNGKPDSVAITVLSEIVYWYRPKVIFDETSGELIGYKRKFKSDKLQLGYQQLADKFGYTKTQIKSAINTLCELGIVHKELRNIYAAGQTLSNVMFLDLDVDKLLEITYPPVGSDAITASNTIPADIETDIVPIYNTEPSVDGIDTLPVSNHGPPPLKQGTYTKTTTKITTNTTTDTSSIYRGMDEDEKYNRYEVLVKENIEYDFLMDHLDISARQRVKEIVNLILEVLVSKSKTIRINGEDKPAAIVRSVFSKLTREHISYVLQSMDDNPSRIHNIKAYLLTALYNAPHTITNHYVAKAAYDLEHGFPDVSL